MESMLFQWPPSFNGTRQEKGRGLIFNSITEMSDLEIEWGNNGKIDYHCGFDR